MQTINYESFVKSARAAARDILRSRKVSALLGYIRTQKAKIKAVVKGREDLEKRHAETLAESAKTVERTAYQLRLAEETNNPDLENIKGTYEETKKEHDAFVAEQEVSNKRELEDYDARGKETTKAAEEKIAEYHEKIENWQNGTSKVDFTEMVALAESMMQSRVVDAFNEGEYDDYQDDDEDESDTPSTSEEVA